MALIAFAIGLVGFLVFVVRFWWTSDDAFITFRHARNLVDGHGIRFNIDEMPPVEGYSDFLWLLVCAGFEAIGADMMLWPNLVSVGCGIVLLWQVCQALGRLEVHPVAVLCSVALLSWLPALGHWGSGGLETMPYALLSFVCFDRLVLRRDGVALGAVIALLVALIRLEGYAWVVVMFVMAAWTRRGGGLRGLRPLLLAFAAVTAVFALYYAWRWSYFESPLPNTAYAKAELDGPRLVRGLHYVASFFLTFPSVWLVVPGALLALRRDRRPVGLVVAAMAFAYPAYSVVVTGDFMAFGRFLVPAFAYWTLLWALVFDRAIAAIGTRGAAAVCVAFALASALPGWNLHLLPAAVRDAVRFREFPGIYSEHDMWMRAGRKAGPRLSLLGRGLRELRRQRQLLDDYPSAPLGAVGQAGYYSGFKVYDRCGLVTPEVAHRKILPSEPAHSAGHDKNVPEAFFLKHRPTVFAAEVGKQRLSAAQAAAASEERAKKGGGPVKQRKPAGTYVEDLIRFTPVDGTGKAEYLFVEIRLPEGADTAAAADAWNARVDSMRAGKHAPFPER